MSNLGDQPKTRSPPILDDIVELSDFEESHINEELATQYDESLSLAFPEEIIELEVHGTVIEGTIRRDNLHNEEFATFLFEACCLCCFNIAVLSFFVFVLYIFFYKHP